MTYFVFLSVVAIILLAIFFATAFLCYLVRHSNHGQKTIRDRNDKGIKITCVMGSGGHTTEMVNLLANFDDRYSDRTYIIADTDKMSMEKVAELERSHFSSERYYIETIPRSREVGQAYLTSIFTTLISIAYTSRIVWKHESDLLIVNGPGTCIPIVFWTALFDLIRLRDTMIIFEESICRVHRLSMTGHILYFSGLADDIIVQWKSLQALYPRSRFIGDLEE